MYIDFHTHLFPDSIAASTVALLAERCQLTPSTDGTADGLRRSMNDAGITLSVALPVVTKPAQFDSVNRFAAAVNAENDRVVSFGGIHPDNDNVDEKLDYLVTLGFKGIKLHPDYQGVFIDDERYRRILQGAVDRNLLVSIHAGIDKGLPDTVHCPPDRARKALDALTLPDEPRIIFAHGGGWGCWDEVERYLVGQPVFFDLAVTVEYIDEAQLLRIIRHHSASRILFATDAPWGYQADIVRRFEALPLTDDERDAIAYRNAAALLGIGY